jgi:hypothetical protein
VSEKDLEIKIETEKEVKLADQIRKELKFQEEREVERLIWRLIILILSNDNSL